MSNWNVQIEGSGSTFIDDGTIPRPNENLETMRMSTWSKAKLANGDYAFILPETKYTNEPFTMTFLYTTAALRSKIEGYIEDGEKVKIITHTGESFIGYFFEMRRVWFTGLDDTYDIQVTFEICEEAESG